LSPSTVGWLNAACDCVVQTYKRRKTKLVTTKIGGKTIKTIKPTKGVDFCLRTGPDDTYFTKFRMPRDLYLPEVIVKPTFERIHKIIRGESKRER